MKKSNRIEDVLDVKYVDLKSYQTVNGKKIKDMGVFQKHNGKLVIFIDKKLKKRDQRMTLYHEAFHLVLGLVLMTYEKKKKKNLKHIKKLYHDEYFVELLSQMFGIINERVLKEEK